MTKKMLIDASHPEETRVVIVDGNRVEELDFESRNKRQLRGNVYLARVTRVEPSLQAAFIEYGGNRHGFLAFSEIHPDYYQIPYEDRMKLIEDEQADAAEAEEEAEKEAEAKEKAKPNRRRRRSNKSEDDADTSDNSSDNDDDSDDEDDKPKRKGRRRAAPARSKSKSKDVDDDENDDDSDDDSSNERDENLDPDDDDVADANDAEVAEEQVKVASKRRKRQSRRRYKIQEVIKRGQILLVQAVKEERGNKGAAMTTYLSLAGRYCVLMPNTPRGGGISRKIANGSDRKRLKSVMSELEVPKGMGVIVRTAGAKRTKAEIKRDYDYLSRLWSDIREKTLKSIAPALIHEEGNLVKRSIRDLYNKDIEEVLVEGDDAYKTAKAFIKMLMPSHAKFVKQYKDDIPLFLRYNVERQIEDSLNSVVQLKSGGYLVIHPTEALVSVDVNSGRSTKERNVERTALRTNLEAAEELARQMRLRDLAGLIVIDFIDMDENKNNRAVEKKMKEMLERDRARIQTSRISQFGLMEISRQRRRRSLLEGSTAHCEHCAGVGRKRTIESSALAAIRAVEEIGVRRTAKRIRLKTSPDVALYLFNEKRNLLQHVEENSDVFTEILGDDELIRPTYEIEVIEKRSDKEADPLDEIEKEFKRQRNKPKSKRSRKSDNDNDDDADETSESREDRDDDNKSSKRRGRRGRRGGRGRRNNRDQNQDNNQDTSDQPESKTKDDASDTDAPKKGRRRKAPAKSKANDKGTDTSKSDTSKSEDQPKPEEKTEKPKRAAGRRKAPARKSADTPQIAEEKAEKPKSRRKAPAKAKAEDGQADTKAKSDSDSSRRRKAPAKKPAKKAPARRKAAAAKPVDTPEVTETVTKLSSSTSRRRAAPTKAKPEEAANADAEVKPSAPKKKAAPKRKTAPKAKTTPAKKAPAKKAPAKKAAPKAKKAEPAQAKPAEPKPAETALKSNERTRKAPSRKPAPAKADGEPPKKKKKGWLKRLISDD